MTNPNNTGPSEENQVKRLPLAPALMMASAVMMGGSPWGMPSRALGHVPDEWRAKGCAAGARHSRRRPKTPEDLAKIEAAEARQRRKLEKRGTSA
jgi:hypothetical protein